MKSLRVLIIETDSTRADHVLQTLSTLELLHVETESDPAQGPTKLAGESFDIALLGLHRGCEGLKLLKQLRDNDITLPVILLDETPTVETAVECGRLGPSDYLSEPFDADALRNSVTRLTRERRLDEENALLRRQIERPYSFDDIVGTSPAMTKVFETITQVAESNVDVLVIGETGTGKELIARSIHRRSKRANKPFVPVDCGAIPENLLESEFFGHERGAFTGADSRRIGLLEFADGGTFFLDEIGELPLMLQAKLLRTLQERKIRRVGGREEIDIDVRIVAATARDLEEMIRQKRFREDLYYRINVIRIDLPPLRSRGDDLGLLAERFAVRFSREMGKTVSSITPEAYQVLSQYHWPGNVRELQNVIRRGIALSQTGMLGVDNLPDNLVTAAGDRAIPEGRGFFQLRDECVARFERDYLETLLKKHQGNVKTAAKEAGLPRGTLYRLMKNHEIEGADYR